MKKLSELKNSTLLCIRNECEDISVVEKYDIMREARELSGCRVSIAEPVYAFELDLYDVIERLGEDEMYEGWAEDVYETVREAPVTERFLAFVKEVIRSKPTFYEGEPVEIDVIEYKES